MTTNPADLKLEHIADVCQSHADNCQHEGHFVLFIQGSSFPFQDLVNHGSLSSNYGQQDRDMCRDQHCEDCFDLSTRDGRYRDDCLPSPPCPQSAPVVRVESPPRGKDHRKCKDFSNGDLLTAQSLDI